MRCRRPTTFFVPPGTGNGTLSFLGVPFNEGAVVSRVRITSGNQILGPGGTQNDAVAMDDFIYGEPVAATPVPEPATFGLFGAGLAAALVRRRSARRRA